MKSKKEQYRINTAKEAKKIASEYLHSIQLENIVVFGLPEIDDRYHIWRVPLRGPKKQSLGEIVIDAISTLIDKQKTTSKEILESRILLRDKKIANTNSLESPKISNIISTVGFGDSELLLDEVPANSVDLAFTSPPYYNARPEYSDYLSYDEYLLKMKKIIHKIFRVLNEGRFFIINISPILLRRTSRSESSKRIAVPFDFHRLLIEENFEFIDDIIWEKPEGAGWATGRGRRFAADRNPLQYKPVPVTEYVLVYRKKSDKLIDWLIRKHPNKDAVRNSKIADGYERTNIWKIPPAHSKIHPAVFPEKLVENIIRYYSFEKDVVLDPFAGSGTTGRVAHRLHRRFVMFENDEKYIKYIKKDISKWNIENHEPINWINIDTSDINDKNLFSL